MCMGNRRVRRYNRRFMYRNSHEKSLPARLQPSCPNYMLHSITWPQQRKVHSAHRAPKAKFRGWGARALTGRSNAMHFRTEGLLVRHLVRNSRTPPHENKNELPIHAFLHEPCVRVTQVQHWLQVCLHLCTTFGHSTRFAHTKLQLK